VSFIVHRVAGSRTVLSTVDREVLRIGRGAGADLRFEDTAVALDHALIRASPTEEGSYEVHDLGSVTGTYVNGEPVSSARLRDGDEIGIGGWLLKVRRSDPEDPLFLHVRPADAEPRPDAEPVVAPRIDYAGAYRLRRGILNKAFFGLVATLAALLAVAALAVGRRWQAFQPGELTAAHAGRVAPSACGACHAPFAGATDRRCQECHGPGAVDETPAHHGSLATGSGSTSAASAPGCATCHAEHLGTDGLLGVADGRCLSCHRDLALPSGTEPVFAARVTSFTGDHPELRIDLPGDGEGLLGSGARVSGLRGTGLRRVPVTDPAARTADPTAIDMSHAKHLKPGIITPEGPKTLTCEDCHRADPEAPTGMVPIRFDAVCTRCHALTFDDRYPDEVAPHGPPQEVHDFLFGLYQDRQMAEVSARQRRLDALRGTTRRDFDPRLRQEAVEAEARLYQRCARCHWTDLDASPYPVIEPPRIPERWFPHARFDHDDHRLEGLQCEACHAGARTSDEPADLLLPGIAACRPCHGGTDEPAPFPVSAARDGCRTCHDYHSGADFPAGPLARRPARLPGVRPPPRESQQSPAR